MAGPGHEALWHLLINASSSGYLSVVFIVIFNASGFATRRLDFSLGYIYFAPSLPLKTFFVNTVPLLAFPLALSSAFHLNVLNNKVRPHITKYTVISSTVSLALRILDLNKHFYRQLQGNAPHDCFHRSKRTIRPIGHAQSGIPLFVKKNSPHSCALRTRDEAMRRISLVTARGNAKLIVTLLQVLRALELHL